MIEQEVRGSSAEGAEWVGFLAGGVPLPVGGGLEGGCVPSPENILNFELKMVRFGAFCAVLGRPPLCHAIFAK